MIIDICVGILTLSFAVLTVFFIKTLTAVNGTLKQTKQTLAHMQKELSDLSQESTKLIKTANSLTTDIKEKTSSLNFVFRPLQAMNKDRHSHAHPHVDSNIQDKVSCMLEWVTAGITLYKQFRGKD